MGNGQSELGGGDLKFKYAGAFNLDNQSKSVGEAWRVAHCQNKGDYFETSDSSVTTLYENFVHGCKVAGDGEALGWRVDDHYEWMTYDQAHERLKNVGSALAGLQLSKDGEGRAFVGIYAVNCPEWVLTSHGAYTQSVIPVPLYDTLGAEAVQFIISQTQMQVIVCDTHKKAQQILTQADKVPSLKTIVVIKSDAKDGVAESTDSVQVLSFEQFERQGRENQKPLNPHKADDLAIVCYTSGTTGLPKGVMLTHKALVSCPHSVNRMLQDMNLTVAGPDKTLISFLPLAHIFEQAMEIFFFYHGGRVGFFSGQTLKILDDMKILKPTMFPLVPRLLSRLYDKVQVNLGKAGAVGNFLFQRGYNAKLAMVKQGYISKNTFWDRLIFQKVQAELGGNVEMMITGAAPISAEVLELCRVVLGCIIAEGYGQTECSAACSITIPGDHTAGHVGPPLSCNEIKLDDVPDMNYFAKDNKGEICVRGCNVMQGYLNEPEKTAEALDSERWLHTGDIGQWQPDGTLKVIDRKKNIFKLAQGEYVAPEKIENVYTLMALVQQVFVDGLSTETCLVAVVVPDEHALRKWYKNQQPRADTVSLEALCDDESVRAHVLREMTAHGKAQGLNSLEVPKAVHLSAEPFSLENDLLTPTMKSKRPQLRKRYDKDIKDMYKQLADAKK